MRVSPHSPAHDPTFDATTVRGAHRLVLGSGGLGGLPVFSWPGLVNFTDISPVWIMFAARDFQIVHVVMADGNSTLGITILVNEVAVESFTAFPTYQQTVDISVSVSLHDTVRLSLTSFGAGDAENLTVALF